jgi:hypothetical protein
MKRIALYMHEPICDAQCANGLIASLEGSYRFKLFGKNEMQAGFLDDVDAVLFPGGLGDSDRFDRVAGVHKSMIQDYVQQGGCYLGVCMGAYWADKNYFDILEETRVEQYITQPGTDTRRPHPKAMPVNWRGELTKMFFYDGCTFLGGKQDVYATYDTGYPMAMIQNRIGLIGCHPESQEYWYKKTSYMRGHWHGGQHNRMLLEFVDHVVNNT